MSDYVAERGVEISKPMNPVDMKRWAWNPDRNANETFEDIGEWFQTETGFLRPGKSYPMGYAPDEQERRDTWERWREKKAREFIAGLEMLLSVIDSKNNYIDKLDSDSRAVADAVLAWWDDHNDGQAIPEMCDASTRFVYNHPTKEPPND